MAVDKAEDILLAGCTGGPSTFHVDEWNVSVYLRDPSMADRAEWEAYVQEHKGQLTDSAAGVLAQIFLCDAIGRRLYTKDDIPKLNALKQAGMLQIFKRCVELLAVDEKQIETMEGN
jgi:hypothetical protein